VLTKVGMDTFVDLEQEGCAMNAAARAPDCAARTLRRRGLALLSGHRAGGFVDITTRAKRLVFSGNFNAGAKIRITDGRLVIDAEGKIAKIVPRVDQVSFSGRRAVAQGQDINYVTERCVMKLTPDGLVVTEIAPGPDLARDVLARADTALKVAPDLREMDARLFRPEPMGL
jgi:acyl CoA:acetate/3-ketoacid CoA transferase